MFFQVMKVSYELPLTYVILMLTKIYSYILLKYSHNFDYYNQTINKQCKYHYSDCGGGAAGYSVDPASGRVVVRIPAATDLSRKNRQ